LQELIKFFGICIKMDRESKSFISTPRPTSLLSSVSPVISVRFVVASTEKAHLFNHENMIRVCIKQHINHEI
jgi:hypothetical protein